MSCTSQKFRLFYVSNLSVPNFRIFLLIYPGGQSPTTAAGRGAAVGGRRAANWPMAVSRARDAA